MEQPFAPQSQGLVGNYITDVLDGGPLSIGFHVLMLIACGLSLLFAFRRPKPTLSIVLALSILLIGIGATVVRTLGKLVVLESAAQTQQAAFIWEVTTPLQFSALLTTITIIGCVIVRKLRTAHTPPLPEPSGE